MKRTIRVLRGQEDHSNIECIYDENLFFRDLYMRARACTDEILKVNAQICESWEKLRQHGCALPCQNGRPISYAAARSRTESEYFACAHLSNVISFCADRGQGKTSAMLSYATALSNIGVAGDGEWENRRDLFWKNTSVCKYSFEVLQSIDPTELEPEDSILKVVLSQMYVRFQAVYEREYTEHCTYSRAQPYSQEDDVASLQDLFLTCFHLADRLNDDKRKAVPLDAEDELAYISETGAGMNTRVVLYKLLAKYLTFITRKSDSFLVIPIDDADLNTNRVYNILEDIRKYLQLPRVLVLMATNITQMESIVEQHFLDEYESSLRQPNGMVNAARCHQIAENYLEKVLPGTRRLYLPNLQDEFKSRATAFRISYIDPKTQEDILEDTYTRERMHDADAKENVKTDRWDYQEQLLYFLHKKTGLIFLPSEDTLCPFLPDNMRGLMHFLAFLNDMEDTVPEIEQDGESGYRAIVRWYQGKDEPDARNQWINNLRRFQRYLVDIWSASNLSVENRNILSELDFYADWGLHRYLLQILPSYYARSNAADNFVLGDDQSHRQRFFDACKKHGIHTASEAFTLEGNSYADVCAVLSVLDELSKGKQQQKFIYSIRLYYAIYLHRLLLETLDIPKEIRPRYFFTTFLGDSFMKNGEDNDATIPFAFWRIQIPAESVKALFKEETDTQQQSARFCRWFRHPVEQDGGYIVQNIAELYAKRSGLSEDSDKEEYDDAVWLFHPLYPLLAQMDDLTENGQISAQEDTSDGDFTRPTFEICTELLLNPCLQAELYRNAVAMNQTPSWRRANTMQELFSDSFLVGGLLQHCEALINKVNNFKFSFNGLYPLKGDLGKLELLMWTREFGGYSYSCKKMEYDIHEYEKDTSNEATKVMIENNWKKIERVLSTMGMNENDRIYKKAKSNIIKGKKTVDVGKVQGLLKEIYGSSQAKKKVATTELIEKKMTSNTEEADSSIKTEKITENAEDIHELVKEYLRTMITFAQQDLKKKRQSRGQKDDLKTQTDSNGVT